MIVGEDDTWTSPSTATNFLVEMGGVQTHAHHVSRIEVDHEGITLLG
jgi:hypothetical protein